MSEKSGMTGATWDSTPTKCIICTTVEDKSMTEHTTVFGQTGDVCFDCLSYADDKQEVAGPAALVVKDDPTDASWWDDDYPYPNGAISKLDLPTKIGAKIGAWSGAAHAKTYKPLAPSCYHNLTPFKINDEVTVYLSGSSDLNTKEQGPMPAAGVYLADTWNEGGVWTNDKSLSTKLPTEIPSMYVAWPDFGTISIERLALAVAWTLKKLKAGRKVEIGCMGGHGRTGTFAAALCVAYGMGGAEAVAYVKATYCKKAVENPKQEQLVIDWDTHARGEEDGGNGTDRATDGKQDGGQTTAPSPGVDASNDGSET